MICSIEYSNVTLMYTYMWLYSWFIFIYLPWRLYTGDSVYSILDFKQTPLSIVMIFIGFIHFLVFLSNMVGYCACKTLF
jgi:hypothetical protein